MSNNASFPTSTATATSPVGPIPTVVPTPVEYVTATRDSVRTLWVVFGVMTAASAVFAYLAHRTPLSNRLYHVVTTLITVIAALSYFAMASGSGSSLVCARITDVHDHVPDTSHVLCRQTFWARYVDWALTTPLLVLDLSLLAGLDGARTLIAIAADLVMILGGLFAAYGGRHATRRWGWYIIAWLAFVTVIWHVGYRGSRAARAKGDQVAKVFAALAPFTLVLWVAYPAVWAAADGLGKLGVDNEIIAYAILDILAKVAFGAGLLAAHRRVPETHVELDGYWTTGAPGHGGRIRLTDQDGA